MSPVLLREGIYRYPRIIAGGIIYCTHVRVQYIIVGSYVPSPANTVDILAVRHVKQGIETARFRTDSSSHSCQYVCMYKPLDLISNRKYREATWNGKYGDRSHKLGNAVAFLVCTTALHGWAIH